MPDAATLYRGGRVRTPADPFATALVVQGAQVVWVGSDAAADALGVDRVVELADALVAPAFVDAHVHTTATGLALSGLDLSGLPSLAAALDALERHARSVRGGVVLGTGWDETAWPERRPPTAAELDRASYGGVVYLARTDVHSAVASSALLAVTGPPRAEGLPGWAGDGLVRLAAHHAVRRAAYSSLSIGQRLAAQRRTRAQAARLGIGALHEMAGPDISSEADLAALVDLTAAEAGPGLLAYWNGEVAEAVRLGAQAGGDLFCDGTLGSHTAALHAPYADAPASLPAQGELLLEPTAVRDYAVEATRLGLQAGFHVIGDRAVDAALDGLELAAGLLGADAVARARHRLEHAEMASPAAVGRMARLGLLASVQPAFDAAWGGDAGMYAERLGAGRAAGMNPFAGYAAAGVPLALSSDAPVTPLDPWGGVRAAVRHRTPGSGLSARAAFSAATRGGWRAARADGDGSGELTPGAPATLAVWQVEGELVVQVPDERVAGWSTDARAGVAGLPDLAAPTPTCLRTLVRGRTVFDAGEL